MGTSTDQRFRNWAWATFGACGVALAGLFFPWMTWTNGINGLHGAWTPAEGQGLMVALIAAVVLGAPALVPLLAPERRRAVLASSIVCGLSGIGLAIGGLAWISESKQGVHEGLSVPYYGTLTVGAGAYITTFGGALIFVGCLFVATTSKRVPSPAMSPHVAPSTAPATGVAS